MSPPLYLDNNASTPVDPRVIAHLTAHLHHYIGNPSSVHFYGQEARKILLEARDRVASFFKVSPRDLIFTSGGTESINLVIRGLLEQKQGGYVITSDVEHPSVDHTLQSTEKKGFKVNRLPVGTYGAVTPEALEKALKPQTTLIVLSAVNSETGVKSDLSALASIAEAASVPLVIDAIALLGKELFDIPTGVSALCFSGQKIHAPKGIGLAIVRRHLNLIPLHTGGEQEYGRRAGTENLPGIVAFAKAIELLQEELPAATYRMRALRDHLEEGLRANLGGVLVNGEGPRVVNTSSLSFENIDGESLLLALDLAGVAVSHGSACVTGSLKPSHVLTAMGYSPQRVRSAIRFSLSRLTTQEEIERCITIVTQVVKRLRK